MEVVAGDRTLSKLPLGSLGIGGGIAAAVIAATERPASVAALVLLQGRLVPASASLPALLAPTAGSPAGVALASRHARRWFERHLVTTASEAPRPPVRRGRRPRAEASSPVVRPEPILAQMNSTCAPDGQTKRRRAVLDHVAGAARTYYLLAELANASGARRAAQNFVTSAIRMTICHRKVLGGDLGLTAALARAIEELPDRALSGKSDNAHLMRSC